MIKSIFKRNKPLKQSYEITGGETWFAGEYPGDKDENRAQEKLRQIIHFGIRHFIDLTEENELTPYKQYLPDGITYTRFPIKDGCAPNSTESVHQLMAKVIELQNLKNGHIYVHCWGGVGRTGTIVACYKAYMIENPTIEKVLTSLRNDFEDMPKSLFRETPETQEQLDFINDFINSCKQARTNSGDRIRDCIRGCLMAGASGDALGYAVEFMSRCNIISTYGPNGITEFELDDKGKALISDDTQMTLFTANGILMGMTRGNTRGVGDWPEKYVDGAYLDWYYTQTGKKKEILNQDFHYTWLRDLPEMAQLRAPGNTCLSACESIYLNTKVINNSKGCGGIMRVAPMALFGAMLSSKEINLYSLPRLAEGGSFIAQVTHKHPLGFLPAALLTVLLYRLIPLSPIDIPERMDGIVEEALTILTDIYPNQYVSEKHELTELTKKAISLAHSDIDDVKAISLLGEGWVADEAWAIALYCSIRHIYSVRNAIIASVNHDGDSDSTGSITGNIMGAIYGYEAIRTEKLLCPYGRKFEDTLELHNIILALADDLATGCIINGYSRLDTPEAKQWYERYCEMNPAGIN